MKILRRLTKIFSALLFLIFLGFIVTNAQPSIYTLPAGTKIRVRMDNEINSKVSNVNDTFTATVTTPVVVRGIELIPVGSVFEGRISEVKAAGVGKSNGILDVKFENLRFPDNQSRRIDADLVKKALDGKTSAFATISIFSGTAIGAVLGAVTGKAKGAVIGAGIGAGAGTATALIRKGKEARIKADEEFEIRLNKEVTVPSRDY